MDNKRYKPLVDKGFWWVLIPTLLLLAGATALAAAAPVALIILIAADVFCLYFLLVPLFGYVELREKTLFIKYGFFMEREIPYERIRKVEKERKFYSESMMSLKLALDHVNIKYNSFDVTTVSVKDNDGLINDLNSLIK